MGSMTEMDLVPQRAKSSELLTEIQMALSLDHLSAALTVMLRVLPKEKRLEQQRESSLVQLTELMKELSLACSRDEQTEIQMGSM